MSRLRRGFSTEANDIAREIRRELGLQLADPLDPFRLAEHLEIPVIALSDLKREVPRAVRHFGRVDTGAFSAVTVFEGPRRLIVHNNAHVDGRQNSNVAHELSHGLLLHPPTPAFDNRGARDWDPVLEEEANWLAGALLVSEEAALSIVRRGWSLAVAAAQYGTSEAMMQFRINVTGARKRVARARRGA